MVKNNPNLIGDPVYYFKSADSSLHKQYLAMRKFFIGGATAADVALQHGYTVSTVYAYARDLKEKLGSSDEDPYFKEPLVGRKKLDHGGEIDELIIAYRKRNFSVPEIKAVLDAQNYNVSERYISLTLKKEGFTRLPRRDYKERSQKDFGDLLEDYSAPISTELCPEPAKFQSQLVGLMLFLPIIKDLGIDKIIEESDYPETSTIGRVQSILSFVALKLSDVERYSMDDVWCMDRGMGLFAGLNVLPKTTWFSSYSSRVTRQMNLSFLRKLRQLWHENDLLSDTANLDFTAIPYWGDDDPFENNWSGKRTKALASIQAVLAQDPDSGILCYGDTTIRHENESDIILEFLDFYHNDPKCSSTLKYLVFDSKFTTYENLNKLNKQGLKFITIQRRSKKLEDKISNIPQKQWEDVKVMRANGKGRIVSVCENITTLSDYEGEIRQVFIASKGRIKPAIIITNDFDISLEALVRKYSQRWLVEKGISEHIHFFHLNRNSSGIVVKVDFDLTMTILAHNLFRIFAQNIDGYSHCEAKTLFTKFIDIAGEVSVSESEIVVSLKKKRTLPLILEHYSVMKIFSYQWLHNKTLRFVGASTT